MSASPSQLPRLFLAAPSETLPVSQSTALCGPSTSSGVDRDLYNVVYSYWSYLQLHGHRGDVACEACHTIAVV